MAQGNILITGCDTGLGLEFARYLCTLDNVNRVYAGYMDLDKAKDLFELSTHPKIQLIKLLVDDDDSIAEAKAEVEAEIGDEGLNVLINNAAIHERDYWLKGHPKREVFLQHYDVNTIGPIMVTGAFLPLLKTAAKNSYKAIVLNISSDLASIQVARHYQCNIGKGIGIIAYGITKCAMNHFTSTLAYYETKNGIISIALHPGLMRTQMGGPTAPLGPDEAARLITNTVNSVTIKDSGRYIDNNGNDMAW